LYQPHTTFQEPENKDVKIWRYMDLPKLISILDKKSLFFTKVSKLDDPYEGTIPEYNSLMRKITIVEQNKKFPNQAEFNTLFETTPNWLKKEYEQLREIFFVNSWHINEEESASMWKLYSHDNYGVAIQSTFKKLCESFHNTADIVWAGRVEYLDFKKDRMEEGNLFNPFVVKRKSFSCDAELRAAYAMLGRLGSKKIYSRYDETTPKLIGDDEVVIDDRRLTNTGRYIDTDLNILVEKIYLSPKAGSWVTNIVDGLLEKYGLDKEVIRSELYSLR